MTSAVELEGQKEKKGDRVWLVKFNFHFSLNDSNFRKPIAVQEVRKGVDESPSPNTYNLSGVHTGKSTVITAESAFKSRSADLGCGQLTWGVVR